MDIYEGTIVVINKVDTLRRLTVKSLENQWIADIRECKDTEEALAVIEAIGDNLIIIMEFGISDPTKYELLFLDKIKRYSWFKNMQIIITAQRISRTFVMSMAALGIRNILLKTYNLMDYAQRLSHIITTGCQSKAA